MCVVLIRKALCSIENRKIYENEYEIYLKEIHKGFWVVNGNNASEKCILCDAESYNTLWNNLTLAIL